MRCADSTARTTGRSLLIVLCAVLGAMGQFRSVTASATAVPLVSDREQVLINLRGGLPGRWESCRSTCSTDDEPRTLLGPMAGQARIAWDVAGDDEAGRELDNLEYEPVLRRANRATTVILTSRIPFRGIRLIHRYRLSQDGRVLSASLQMPPGARLKLVGGPALAGTPLDGLASVYSRVRAVTINSNDQFDTSAIAGNKASAAHSTTLPAGEWTGIRGRFWTILLQSGSPLQLYHPDSTHATAPEAAATGRVGVTLGRDGNRGGIVELRFYGGPVAAADLQRVAPELDSMLYAGLWQWLRMLATGLRHLLEFWQSLVGNWGLAVVLLSLSVKFLMWPLTWVAERWQADVNRKQSLLAPELAAVKRELKGEAAHNRTLEIYRQHGVSPLYTFKSLAGFLVQIPVFIAAFDMLGEHIGLSGARFLWVPDLALPDRVLALPLAIPGLGGYLNLLPVLMAVLSISAACLQEDPSLAPALRRAHRWRLYAMTGVFFLLLYAFPAGMVLYWTTNNFLHLLKMLLSRVAGRPATGALAAGPAGVIDSERA